LELGKWLTWLKNVSTTAGVTAAPTVAVFITIVLLSFCSPRRMSSIYLGGWNNLKQSSPSELSPCRAREKERMLEYSREEAWIKSGKQHTKTSTAASQLTEKDVVYS